MVSQAKDLWSLIKRHQPEVDPNDLAQAVEAEAAHATLDYRTRLLIRDSVAALEKHWGEARLAAWLAGRSTRARIEAICREHFERPGFPFLEKRMMEKTDPEGIRQFIRELGTHVVHATRLNVGGSASLILTGHLARNTEDIDVVDEVPEEIRRLHPLLQRLHERFGLAIAHFQSHYLPSGWENRVHSLGPFGKLHVFLVDVYDIFLSKLFSGREKDRDDLRVLAPQLDKETLQRRFRDTTASLQADATLHQRAVQNWYILYGATLPS